MKILYVAEFDPANVLSTHVAVLKKRGHDARLAVRDVYREPPRNCQSPDWFGRANWNPEKGFSVHNGVDYRSLRDFTKTADVVVACPGIGQPWSWQEHEKTKADRDVELLTIGGVGVVHEAFEADRPIVAYFHGSWHTQHNFAAYVEKWREGFGAKALWASTINYCAASPGVRWAPPVFDFNNVQKTALRDVSDPLSVIQAPTDIRNCHTVELKMECENLGIVHRIVTGESHEKVLHLKRYHNFGFDHLRGGFSVNTVENMAIGLAPCFRIDSAMMEVMRAELHPYHYNLWTSGCLLWPVLHEGGPTLRETLSAYARDPELTRSAQSHARLFYEEVMSPESAGHRLENLLDEAMA